MEFFKRLLVIFVFLGILVNLFFYLGGKCEKQKSEKSYYSDVYFYSCVLDDPAKFWLPESKDLTLAIINWDASRCRTVEQYSTAANGKINFRYQIGPDNNKEKKFFDLIVKSDSTYSSYLRICGQATNGSKIQIEYIGDLFVLKLFCKFHLPTSLEINSLVRKILKQEGWDIPTSYL